MTKMRVAAFWLFTVIPACCETAVADGSAATVPAVVKQPRTFGYTLGDLVRQRVLLQADGRAFAPQSMPAAQRIGAWFERRPARLEVDSELRRWLVIDYQIVNAPQGLRSIRLPPWQLVSAGGSGRVLSVPEWTVSVSPLTAGVPSSADALQPDHPPPRIPREPRVTSLERSVAALGMTGIAWLAWWGWRRRRASARLPFARAWREMRRLDGGEPRAWQALHRAIDQTAGRVIQPSTLPALFDTAPELAEMRDAIEEFFRQSSLLFFGAGTGAGDAADAGDAAGAISPRDLCARLRQIERRYER